jgi:hypothetical protein
VEAHNLKKEIQPTQARTTPPARQYPRNAEVTRTNDRNTPKNAGAPGPTFQRQLEREVSDNREMRTVARDRLGRVMDRLQDVNRENEVTRQNGALRNEANRSVRQVNVGGVRA